MENDSLHIVKEIEIHNISPPFLCGEPVRKSSPHVLYYEFAESFVTIKNGT